METLKTRNWSPSIVTAIQPGMTSRTVPTTLSRSASATAMLVLAAVLYGMVPGFARELQSHGVPSSAIALYRFAFSMVVTLPFLPVVRRKRRQGLKLFGAGVLVGFGWIGYLDLLQTTSIAAAGIVYMSYPVFAVMFAWLLASIRPSPRSWLACAAVLAATFMVNGDAAAGLDLGGILRALPAPVTFGLSIVVMTTMVPDLNALERASSVLCGALCGLIPLVAMTSPATLVPANFSVLWTILALGLTTSLIPQLLYVTAAPRVGPSRTSATGAMELPTMMIVGSLFFSEPIGLRELLAAACILAGIAVAPSMKTGEISRGTLPGPDRVRPAAG